MSHQVPPPTRVPKKFQEDIEVKGFFDDLLRSVYLIWSGLNVNVSFYGEEEVSQGAALTASDTNTPNSGDATTDAIIANLQTRVDELEARLDSTTGVGLIG